MLRIFTLWKNQSTPAGFEPANLGSSGEYDNHGTTGVDDKESNCTDFDFLLFIIAYKYTVQY